MRNNSFLYININIKYYNKVMQKIQIYKWSVVIYGIIYVIMNGVM